MEKVNCIAAGVVLYNPDLDYLKKSIYKLSLQFSKIILFNNGGFPIDYNFLLSTSCSIELLGNGENVGIAFALNSIMDDACKHGYKWVVTLDQDSIIPSNLVTEFSKHFEENDLAIICPQSIDFRRKYMKIKENPIEEEVSMCITSGSCTNVDVWKKIGGFDSWLFIDLVDNDYCKRVILSGYKIKRLNSVILNHRFGDLENRSKCMEAFFLWLGDITHSYNISKLSFKRKVNPLRIYYENRNVIYLNKKYLYYGGIGYENHHCKTYLGFMIVFSLYSLIVGKDKKAIFISILNGIRDGKNQDVVQWRK